MWWNPRKEKATAQPEVQSPEFPTPENEVSLEEIMALGVEALQKARPENKSKIEHIPLQKTENHFKTALEDRYPEFMIPEEHPGFLCHAEYDFQGGMGLIFVAYDLQKQELCAIKRLRHDKYSPGLTDTQHEDVVEDNRATLAREALLMALLDHPNILKAGGFFWENGEPNLVMKYLDPEVCKNLGEFDLSHDPDLALAIAAQIADALRYCQENGLAHHDLKPENIFLVPEEPESSEEKAATPFQAQLSDWGLEANVFNELPANFIAGTMEYLAPERILREPYDKNVADVFSFGCVVYKMLTGLELFSIPVVKVPLPDRIPAENETAIIPLDTEDYRKIEEAQRLSVLRDILHKPFVMNEHPELVSALLRLGCNLVEAKRVFRKVLAKHPNERYQSADEFIAALQETIYK